VSALGLVVAEVPALPLHTAGKYVAGAYIVLFVIVLIYVAIMAIRLSRMERDLGELLSLSERSAEPPASAPERSAEQTPVGAPPSGAQAGRQDQQPESTPA
jgi:hypothetical protein